MGLRDLIRDALIVGLSGALLWHFSNIWRYGRHLVQEPNKIILILETAGLVVIFISGISGYIIGLKRGTGRSDSERRNN